ncbi:MAG: hypothetical protein IT580_08585 [Verrucomicrobiales bacterium]|nr:hypothetical protein [Verrucomicrobiales bacterium]
MQDRSPASPHHAPSWSGLLMRWLVMTLALVLPLAARPAEPPALQLQALPNQQLRLTWSSPSAGQNSTVQFATRLVDADWSSLPGPVTWPTSGTEWTGPRPISDTAFFRVLVTEAAGRGSVVSNLPLRSFDLAALNSLWQSRLVPGSPTHAVTAWRLVYRTIDAAGQPTIASALLVVPTGATNALPITSYQHGTVTRREDVPSRLNSEADLGLILGSTGYLTLLPDYLGLGDSPGFHPYHHAATHASAVVDALRAVRTLAVEGGPYGARWNQQLFLTGYSQGGHATLAAQRELELHHADEFSITASAPCAGAYDLSGTMANDLLSTRLPPNPYYSAYLLHAYVHVYGNLAPSLGDLLRPPYSSTVPPLFDGTHDSGEINAALPAQPALMLKPEVLEALRTDPQHPIRLALKDNDLHTGWIPRSPTRLYHCPGDQDVLFANSQVASDTFKAAGGAPVEVINPWPFSDLGHGECVPFALLGAKFWFDGLKH